MLVDRSTIASNGTFALAADGPSATLRVGSSVITGNGTGCASPNGGTMLSYKNNSVNGNTNDNTPLAQVNLN